MASIAGLLHKKPDGDSKDYEATSILQFVNSQLVAHGSARSPCADSYGLADGKRVVKCLSAMIDQQVVGMHAWFLGAN